MLWNAKNGSVPVGSTEMSYVSFGYGKKHLVILPGLSDGLTTVKGKALLLAKPYQVFFDRYTVSMFSRKDDMPDGYSIRDMADDQAGAMKTLGMTGASVLGVSEGGMIAQCLAAKYPDLVEKLIIAVSAPACNGIIKNRIARWVELASRADHKQLMIDTAENSYSEAYLAKYRNLYPMIGMIGKPRNYRRFLINAEAILHFDASEDIKRISCPTLIIGGTEDRIVGIDASYEIRNGIKNSELYLYPGLGHAVYEEADDFNSRVFAFLEQEAS